MRIQMYSLAIIVIAASIVSAQNSSSTPSTPSNPSTFGSLPEANYTADDVPTVDTGSLKGLFDMAKGFVNVVFKPFSDLAVFMEDIIEIILGDSDQDILGYLGENWQDMAEFEAGFIACLVFGVLFIVFVPLVGSIMCCCRCCENCGGRLEQSTERSKSCWRQCLCVTMLILTTLMAVPTVFVFLNNEWVTEVINNGPKKIEAVLVDTTRYLEVVPTQINYVADQYSTVDDNVRPLVSDFGQSVGVPYQQFVEDASADSMAALSAAAQVQTNTLTAIDVANSSIDELSTGMRTLDASLAALRANMTTELNVTECLNDTVCLAVLGSVGVLDVGFDVTEIEPLQDDLTDVKKDLEATNITQQQADVQKEIDDIPQTVEDQTKGASDDAVAALDQAKGATDDISSALPLDQLDNIETQIDDFSTSLTSAVKSYNDNFDQYRRIAGLVLGSILAFIVACYLLGMLLGICGNGKKVTPAERGCASNCGGIWLMVGVGFSFIFSWLLMILVVVTFSIGGHGERYGCQGLEGPDYEALQLVEKVSTINLTQTLNLPPESQLSLISLLTSCENDEPIYSAMKLEYLFNVTAFLSNVTSDLVDVKDNLDQAVDDVDLSEIEIYTKETQDDVLALKSTGINTINFTEYSEDLGKGITETDLTAYAQGLRAQADAFTNASALKPMVYAHAAEVDRIQAEEVVGLQDDYDGLTESIDDLIDISSELNTTIDTLDSALTQFNTTIATGSKAVIQQIADDVYGQVEGNVTAYTNWAGKQIEDEVGACRPIFTAYSTTVGVFCDYLIDTINGLWFSLGWCLFFLIPSAIVAMKLMKFFRRMNYEDNYEDSWDEMEMRDYGAPPNNKPNGAYY